MTSVTMIHRIETNDPTLTECEHQLENISDISEFAEALKVNRKLTKLVLGVSKLKNAGGIALAGALKVNVALTEIV